MSIRIRSFCCMYKLNKNIAFLGIAIASLSTIFFPFLRVTLVGNWNLYEVDSYLFYITNGFLLLMLLLVFMSKVKAFRFLTISFFVWCIIALVAVFFKTNNYFGKKFADGLISKTIDFKWGWVVLVLSAVLLLLSVRKLKD